MPGYEGAVNSAFAPDGALNEIYMRRVRGAIDACQRAGAAVILSCYYQRQDQILKDEAAVKAGVVNVARWIRDNGLTNVALEIANEYPHGGFDHKILLSAAGNAELIRLAKATAPDLLVSSSGIGDGELDEKVAVASDFVLIHFNGVPLRDIPRCIAAQARFGKPVVCNEDDKTGVAAAQAASLSVASGASWGLMLQAHNQTFPFHFDGAADDAAVYDRLAHLTAPATWPGDQWSHAKPGESGLREEKLAAIAKLLGGRGCIVRGGRLVYGWGDIARVADVASAAKPVFAHLLWKAIEAGRIGSLDEPVLRHEPRLAELNTNLGNKDREITWRQLATQTSGYGVAEKPGEAFDYNDRQMALFFDLLLLKAYQTTYEDMDERVLRPLLADRLGCQDKPTLLAFGKDNRPGRLAISPRDFARFGLLYLRNGRWRGEQLISSSHALAAVTTPLPAKLPRTAGTAAEMLPGARTIGGEGNQTDHFGSYSFLWWIDGADRDGRRHWPDAPPGSFAALGHNGERGLAVVPNLDIVVSWNDATAGRENELLKLVAEAAR
jgi:hypothetical protein